MNHFELIKELDDFGVTVIENSFINHYMPHANGDYVKVYLLGLKYCFASSQVFPSNAEIANIFDLTESDVINAFKYWEKEGILSYREIDGDVMIDYKLITNQLMLRPSKKVEKKAPKDSGKIRQMYKDIEGKLGRLLSHSEMDMFLEWIELYKFTPQTIVLLITDCIDREKKGKAYWESMALEFNNKGIKTYDQALNFIDQRTARWASYKAILNYMGFYRLQSKPEQAFMDKWLDEYKLDIEELKLAINETVATNKITFKYVDTVLTSWQNGGKDNPKESPAPKGKGGGKKNLTGTEHNYDIDELEKALFGDE